MPFPARFLKQLSARFQHCWKAARPCCCMPDICPHSCLGVWGVLPKIEWVAPSMFGQWIHAFFRRGHPQLYNRQTILVSLECTGPYHVTVEVSSLSVAWFSRYNCFSAFIWASYRKLNFWSIWIKNNRTSRTTQRIEGSSVLELVLLIVHEILILTMCMFTGCWFVVQGSPVVAVYIPT